MSRYNSPSLLTPPREDEEVYPYRRVWPSIFIEVGALFGVVTVLYVALGALNIGMPDALRQPLNVAIALTPLALWLAFSRLPETRVPQPRLRLTAVLVITALTANAVSLPLLGLIDPDAWLPLAGRFERILGYGMTVGVVQEMTKYLVVWLLVWPIALRMRLDALAYFAASAIGYVTVVNLSLVFANSPAPDVVALRVFSNTVMHLAASSIVAYGMAELRFRSPTFFVMPLSLLLACIVSGVAISFRATLVSGGFVLGIGGTRPLFGLIFSLVLIVGVLAVVLFLFNTTERREREAIASREV